MFDAAPAADTSRREPLFWASFWDAKEGRPLSRESSSCSDASALRLRCALSLDASEPLPREPPPDHVRDWARMCNDNWQRVAHPNSTAWLEELLLRLKAIGDHYWSSRWFSNKQHYLSWKHWPMPNATNHRQSCYLHNMILSTCQWESWAVFLNLTWHGDDGRRKWLLYCDIRVRVFVDFDSGADLKEIIRVELDMSSASFHTTSKQWSKQLLRIFGPEFIDELIH